MDLQITKDNFDALAQAAPSVRQLWIKDMDHVLKVEKRSPEQVRALAAKKMAAIYGEARPLHPKLLPGVTEFLLSSAWVKPSS